MHKEINVGKSLLHSANSGSVTGEYLPLFGDEFYCIRNYDHMPPFFMSIVSSSDHWMFISSSGGLTAGRSNAESALFPYYTDDKITENNPNTGPVSILRVTRAQKTFLWEPFSTRYDGLYQIERNIYKNIYGNQLIFEELNHDLQLSFRTIWQTSEKYGFAKTGWLKNTASSACSVEILDGLQNLLPHGASTAMQNTFSNLLNAYKRSELEPRTGLGMFSLSSTLTDLAEPSESLKATLAWHLGLENARYLLSTGQLEAFRRGAELCPETDMRGQRGAYLVNANCKLAAGAEKEWTIVCEVAQDAGSITELARQLEQDPDRVLADLKQDIKQCSAELRRIVASADGLQLTADRLSTAHHFANVLFNSMRGGIFADHYTLGKDDFLDFVSVHNRPALSQYADFFASLPEKISVDELAARAAQISPAANLQRLCYEYLPLTFSRRHGDPSRPWNKFSINLKKPDGARRLDYQGNWRDIFQNWEPLAWSYPEFTESLICKFLNATTADGYNPYRITRDGVEWETPAPDDPWANIGYWGDHQIIYLLNLLEISHRFHPGRLQELLGRSIFSSTNVPYRIKPYAALLEDPFTTISFDWQLESQIETSVKAIGTDGRLLLDHAGQVLHVNMLEKLLSLLLAKLANFVPEGGIWMNTQRPEWNDANNALVGKGLSVVTLGYLRRFIVFFNQILREAAGVDFQVTSELAGFFSNVDLILKTHAQALGTNQPGDPLWRRQVMDALGQAGSAYRTDFYAAGFSGAHTTLNKTALVDFTNLAMIYVEQSLRANRRPDNLYHAYNILSLADGQATIGHLDEMLEGQVAILGSGLLSSAEAAALLKSLRNSRLFRPDQHSYILYPDRALPGFLTKNLIKPEKVSGSNLVAKLVEQNDRTLITRDRYGAYHFNGSFKNARDVKAALANLHTFETYRTLVEAETGTILDLFESQFNHKAFTGRSGSFFAYEGLGSIYWHMISKLLLAVQELYLRAAENQEPAEIVKALRDSYFDIRAGLGYNKTPAVYGTFPTDPYSHTPSGQGAKQPGMTGQVKEEILTRLRELGIFVKNGQLSFDPVLLRASEFLTQPEKFSYIDVSGAENCIDLPAGSYACTFCQVPLVIQPAQTDSLQIQDSAGGLTEIAGSELEAETSRHIFSRDNTIRQITFYFKTR
jgi:hypothetical protein